MSEWFADDLIGKYRGALNAGLTRGIALVDAEAVRLVTTGSKTGAVYTTNFFTLGTGPNRVVVSYGTRPAHQASAPGESPANDTGTLINSRAMNVDPTAMLATLSFSAPYTLYLELGTDRIEPRPFVRPALMNSLPAVRDVIGQEFLALAA